MPVSKTDFIRALQCEKMLWLDAHAPEFKIIPPEVQARLDQGNEFGDQAMGIFGPFIETTTLREDGRLHFSEMIKKTQLLLEKGEPVVCEAAFSWYGNFCAVDILKKEGTRYAIYEVKNTFSVRKEFILDLGFQRFLLRKSGVRVGDCFLILRGDSPIDGHQVCDELFNDEPFDKEEFIEHNDFTYRVVDVGKSVLFAERIVEKTIFEFGKLKRKDACMPAISPSEHCEKPYRCWYYDFCHKPHS